jgi:NADH-quinone oxidoreductase subunit E
MNLRWVDQKLEGFKGRAVRDKWIEQAKKLASGWRPSSSVGEKLED